MWPGSRSDSCRVSEQISDRTTRRCRAWITALAYSQVVGRHELFERVPQATYQAAMGWDSCTRICARRTRTPRYLLWR